MGLLQSTCICGTGWTRMPRRQPRGIVIDVSLSFSVHLLTLHIITALFLLVPAVWHAPALPPHFRLLLRLMTASTSAPPQVIYNIEPAWRRHTGEGGHRRNTRAYLPSRNTTLETAQHWQYVTSKRLDGKSCRTHVVQLHLTFPEHPARIPFGGSTTG